MRKLQLIISLSLHIIFFILIALKKPSPSIPHLQKNQIANNPIRIIKIPPKPKKDENKKQIVNTQQNNKTITKPVKDVYLGKENNKVEKQTKAALIAPFQEKRNKTSRKKETKEQIKLKDLALDLNKIKIKKKIIKEVEKQEEENSEQNQLAQSNDFLDDIPMGDITQLNTQKFKFFGFYDRIRKSLETHWGVSLKEKAKRLFSSGKTLSAGENYITSLKIRIDQRGNITSVDIIGASGKEELDHAAIDSFNKAGPFPNPPSEMVQGGFAEIEWGFVVKT